VLGKEGIDWLGFKESLQHPPDEEALHAVTEA
jgi:hypothetical protein